MKTKTPRWFPHSVPISRAATARWHLDEVGALPRHDALGYAADRLHHGGVEGATSGVLVAEAALLDAQRWLVGSRDGDGVLTGAADLAGSTLERFVATFPALEPEDVPGGWPVAELLLTRLALSNPALTPAHGLAEGHELAPGSPADQRCDATEAFIDGHAEPVGGAPLFEALRAPQRECPEDLLGQLEVAVVRWGDLLPEELRLGLLKARDLVSEEETHRDGGPGPAPVLHFDEPGYDPGGGVELPEGEGFTPDRHWMPNVVLVAKQTHVWLHQLSRRYGRAISRLDQVPDEELDLLARWGFSALWLIGIWERSHASREIKRRAGNPEALASAYALWDYVVADDIGGEAALAHLKERALARGIRIAADMVPNHVGVDGRWVIEHPDWFVQLDHPPYPGYRFDGPDLCQDDRVSVHLEHGYWDRSDAAVVFRRVDHHTGDTRYVYHGNDGTHMPWNDTAQLDFAREDVRRAVSDQILAVARRFPIIRLDAAMTLARKHIRRLWHPRPGEGGAIPSRAEYGLSPADFDHAMPREFWREVVDRIKEELPDTLLLAEAFWLMEGYFVRTLGMHRVYNSAFMNMLVAEENGKYRETVKNVLAFSPEVLLRFVNFMSNPDEETAVDLFGKGGDKYFGVVTMMVTMPGLPMFAHGQIEGFAEKYGMEYARAYHDEHPDEGLIARHEREVFPLMRLRHLFSQSERFAFYDVTRHDGGVDDNLFAYSNRAGDERALVLYNNVYPRGAGWVRGSVPMRGADEELRTVTFAEGLGLDGAAIWAFREQRSGLTFLRDGRELVERGLFVQLDGYACQVLLDWRPLDGSWWPLLEALQGSGVPHLDEARARLEAPPAVEPDAPDEATAPDAPTEPEEPAEPEVSA